MLVCCLRNMGRCSWLPQKTYTAWVIFLFASIRVHRALFFLTLILILKLLQVSLLRRENSHTHDTSSLFSAEHRCLNLSGDCRTLAFPSFFFFTDKRLANHIIRTEQVPHVQTCELLCYLEPNCVSINFQNKADVDGTFNCELNNSTHRRHDDDFLGKNGYLYRGSDVRSWVFINFLRTDRG